MLCGLHNLLSCEMYITNIVLNCYICIDLHCLNKTYLYHTLCYVLTDEIKTKQKVPCFKSDIILFTTIFKICT